MVVFAVSVTVSAPVTAVPEEDAPENVKAH